MLPAKGSGMKVLGVVLGIIVAVVVTVVLAMLASDHVQKRNEATYHVTIHDGSHVTTFENVTQVSYSSGTNEGSWVDFHLANGARVRVLSGAVVTKPMHLHTVIPVSVETDAP